MTISHTHTHTHVRTHTRCISIISQSYLLSPEPAPSVCIFPAHLHTLFFYCFLITYWVHLLLQPHHGQPINSLTREDQWLPSTSSHQLIAALQTDVGSYKPLPIRLESMSSCRKSQRLWVHQPCPAQETFPCTSSHPLAFVSFHALFTMASESLGSWYTGPI